MLEFWGLDGVNLMKRTIAICLLAAATLLLGSCGSGVGSHSVLKPRPQASALSPVLLSLNAEKTASGLPTGVIVTWQRQTAPQTLGYYLYRDNEDILSADPQLRTNGGNLIPQPASGSSVVFYDEFYPQVGLTYYYRVSALDIYNEESDLSNQLSITIQSQEVTGFEPASGYFGDPVTVTGTNFGIHHPETDSVLFPTDSGEMLSASITSWNQTEIEVTVPHGAITGRIQVVIAGTVAKSDDEFVILSPYLTGLVPDHAAVGQIIEIHGSNLGDVPSGDDRVTFPGGIDVLYDDPNALFWTDALLRVKVPEATANEGEVTVTVSGVTTNGVFFSIHPRINDVQPRLVSPGSYNVIGIYGINFGQRSQGRLWIVDLAPSGAAPPVEVGDLYIDGWSEAIILARVPDADYGSVPAIRVERDGLLSNDIAIGILPPLEVAFLKPEPFTTITAPLDIQVKAIAGMERVEFYLISMGTPVAVDFSGPASPSISTPLSTATEPTRWLPGRGGWRSRPRARSYSTFCRVPATSTGTAAWTRRM